MKTSLVGILVLSGLGCGTGLDVTNTHEEESVSFVQGGIIGGSTLNPDLDTRRRLGLVNVGTKCSAVLLSKDWVITATHCIDRETVSRNLFGIPRGDGTMENRAAVYTTVLGSSDISIVKLTPPGTGSAWPNVVNTIASIDANSLVGTKIRCFGRGDSFYTNPGTSGSGTWKKLEKVVSRLGETSSRGLSAVFEADSDGSNVIAPGDSGGPCFSGASLVAINSGNDVACSDLSSEESCKKTTTKILRSYMALPSLYANYINETVNGAARAQFVPIPLSATKNWVRANSSFGLPEYAVVDNGFMVQLRGKMFSSSPTVGLFTLPLPARPNRKLYVPVVAEGGGSVRNARLLIAVDGTATLHFEGATPAAPWSVTLDGVQYVSERGAMNSAPLSLQNGWTGSPFSTGVPAAAQFNDTVFLMGAIANPSTTASDFSLQLPQGFRPNANVYVRVDMNLATRGRVIIRPDGFISVQAEGDFANATKFTSLEGVSFALNANNTAVSYENGWAGAPFATRHVQFKNDGGILRLQGALSSGTSPWVFTLPAALRPATAQLFWIDGCAARKTYSAVQPTGVVFGISPSAGFDSCFTSFEGASLGL